MSNQLFQRLIMPATVVASLLLFFVAAFVFLHDSIHSKTVYVDINSGRIKTETCRWFILDSHVEETCISIAYCENHSPLEAEWRVDSRFTIFSQHRSPHYKFHGKATEIRLVCFFIRMYNISSDNQKKISYAFLREMQGQTNINILNAIENCIAKTLDLTKTLNGNLDINDLLRQDEELSTFKEGPSCECKLKESHHSDK